MSVKIRKIYFFSGNILTQNNQLEENNYQLEVTCKLNNYRELSKIDLYVLSMLEELLSEELIYDIVHSNNPTEILSWIYYRLTDKLMIENLKLWIDDNTCIEWK